MTQSSFLSKSKKFVSFQQTLYPNLSQKEKKKEEGRNDRSMPVTRPVPQIWRERERRISRVGVSPDYYNYSCGTVINGTAGHFDRSEFPDSMIKNSRGHETMMTERKRERERERETASRRLPLSRDEGDVAGSWRGNWRGKKTIREEFGIPGISGPGPRPRMAINRAYLLLLPSFDRSWNVKVSFNLENNFSWIWKILCSLSRKKTLSFKLFNERKIPLLSREIRC